MAGGEPHFLQDFEDETSWREVAEVPDAIAGNITNMQEWIANVNSAFGGAEG